MVSATETSFAGVVPERLHTLSWKVSKSLVLNEVTFTQSPMLALFTIILYVVVQQIENNLLVPKIMEKAVGLNPIASIIVLMIGFSVGGVMGAILSIPVATAASVVIEDFLHKKKVAEMAD
jgi:predicted PurR-regulated permease PerM